MIFQITDTPLFFLVGTILAIGLLSFSLFSFLILKMIPFDAARRMAFVFGAGFGVLYTIMLYQMLVYYENTLLGVHVLSWFFFVMTILIPCITDWLKDFSVIRLLGIAVFSVSSYFLLA